MLHDTPLKFVINILPKTKNSVTSVVDCSSRGRLSGGPRRFNRNTIRKLTTPRSSGGTTSIKTVVPLLAVKVPNSNAATIVLKTLVVLKIEPNPLLFRGSPKVM